MTRIKDFPKKYNLVPVVNNSKEPSLDQIMFQLFRVIPNVEKAQIIQAFYLSKMTVPDETTPAGQAAYTFLKWPEYVEFICRLAFIKEFKNDRFGEVKLVKKLQPVLECLLALVGQKVTQPTTLAEEVSESDDDY